MANHGSVGPFRHGNWKLVAEGTRDGLGRPLPWPHFPFVLHLDKGVHQLKVLDGPDSASTSESVGNVVAPFTIAAHIMPEKNEMPTLPAPQDTAPRRPPPIDPNRLPEFEVIFRQNDPDDPKNWPTWYRIWAIVTVSFSAWVVVLFSTSYTGALRGLMDEFKVTKTYATMGMTTYLLGLAVGSLIVAPMSELFGRRIVYLVGLAIWAVFIIPCGVAGCLTTILANRFVGYVAPA